MVLSPHDLPPIPPRDAAGHKGTFGRVAVVGGCAGPVRMLGAPVLAGTAAARVGCGLVRLVVPEPLLTAALGLLPVATGAGWLVDEEGGPAFGAARRPVREAAAWAGALAVGPGLGTAGAAAIVEEAAAGTAPVVLDADALRAAAEFPACLEGAGGALVLTPHPGEFAALARAYGLTEAPRSAAERLEGAGALARRLGCVVVLKGRGTVVADASRRYINDTGSAALATGGTGDVLAGVIAGLLAQFAGPDAAGRLDSFACACWGVRLHGLAAEAWSVRHAGATAGMLAGDLCGELPGVVAQARGRAE